MGVNGDRLHSVNGLVGQGIKFERIRRITGYLVGTVDRWNNAKRHELQDRTVHASVKEKEKELELV